MFATNKCPLATFEVYRLSRTVTAPSDSVRWPICIGPSQLHEHSPSICGDATVATANNITGNRVTNGSLIPELFQFDVIT
jgi:hypothetical protein